MDVIKSLVYDYLNAKKDMQEGELLTLVSFRLEDDYKENLESFLEGAGIENICSLKREVMRCREAYAKLGK